ncbi:MAG: alpha/beta hydrolase [Solirubrobacteraceae bacterium]
MASLWLAGGLAAAARYAYSYYEYRGFSPLKNPVGVPSGRLIHESFYSAALGREASYDVYLPPQYDLPAWRQQRFPSMYLLHGSPGKPENFIKIAGIAVRLDVLLRARQVGPMLLVLPDGRQGGNTMSATEWANGSKGRYADFVLDVVRDVDLRLRSRPARAARVLAGYSEGGYGAMNVGLRHLDVFAGIESWSGYFVQDRGGTFAGASPATLAANSPLDYAGSLDAQIAAFPLRAFVYAGSRDGDAQQMAPLAAELTAAGATANTATYPGSHDWALWRAHAEKMLRIANGDFTLAPTRAAPLAPVAARRALLAGRRAATGALIRGRQEAARNAAQLASCRVVVRQVERGAAREFARFSPRGRAVVGMHILFDCLTVPRQASVSLAVCGHLPRVIAIARRDALRRRRRIVAGCSRALLAAGLSPRG